MAAPQSAERAVATGRPVFIFDGDCGFCTTTAGHLRRVLTDDIRVEPWQALPLADLGLTEDDVTSAAYFVDADGSTWRGHNGVAKALEACGGAYRAATVLRHPPLSWLAGPAYALIAKYRYHLPGSTDACRIPQ